MTMYVQFSDSNQTKIISVFYSPQDSEVYDNLGEVEESDPRYLAFLKTIKGSIYNTED